MVMLGALIGTGLLPLTLEDFEILAGAQWGGKRAQANVQAFRERNVPGFIIKHNNRMSSPWNMPPTAKIIIYGKSG